MELIIHFKLDNLGDARLDKILLNKGVRKWVRLFIPS